MQRTEQEHSQVLSGEDEACCVQPLLVVTVEHWTLVEIRRAGGRDGTPDASSSLAVLDETGDATLEAV